jgi:hypothetical protein
MALKQNIEEALADAGIFGLMQLVIRKLTTATGDKVSKGTADFVQKHFEGLTQRENRQQLFADLVDMPWDDKRNIIGHLKKAIEAYDENRVVRILAEIPTDPTESRIWALTYLNSHLPESDVEESEEGKILIELLDDNGAQQWLKKIDNTAGNLAHRMQSAREKRETERRSRKGGKRPWES